MPQLEPAAAIVAYNDVLADCTDPVVGAAVIAAVEMLLANDRNILERGAHERTIAAKLAEYLAPHFRGYDVNVEYNRMGEVPKRLAWNEDKDLVFPDIIVHVIGEPTNLLVVELKTDAKKKAKDDDIRKLRAFREDPDFRYQHALFMRFGVRKRAGTVPECEWV